MFMIAPSISRIVCQAFLVALPVLTGAGAALADDEASNVAHVAAGPYGRCYAKSVPANIYDPDGAPRQQGRTEVFRVGAASDVRLHRFDWFSQRIFLRCDPGEGTVVVRIGPWHRGHEPRADHLAIAFYRGGTLLKRYSTLDIATGDTAGSGGAAHSRNVSASVSHYTVFAADPEMIRIVSNDGPVFRETWVIRATTIDGRELVFDMTTGAVR